MEYYQQIKDDSKLIPYPQKSKTLNNINKVIDDAKTYPPIFISQLYNQYQQLSRTDHITIHTQSRQFISDNDAINIISADDYVYIFMYFQVHFIYFPHIMIDKFNKYKNENYLFCYNVKGDYITFIDIIGEHNEQFVFLGKKNNNIDVMIKWTKNPQELEDELENMIRAETIGVELPLFDDSFFFWDQHILVEEILEPIDGEDDPYEIGRQILPNLHKLHFFGVHNDIKPANIMKRENKYFLIDYGGLAFIPKLYAYIREIWTPLWSSQVKESGQITTAKNDLLELIYVLHYQDALKKGIYIDDDDYKNIYLEPWATLIDQIRNIDERNIKPTDYDPFYKVLGIKQSLSRK
jgi:hypothetical protein